MEEGQEVKWMSLAKVQSVEEMVPIPAVNQIEKWENAKIWEEQYRIIEDTLKMDGTVEEACILAGISVPSYYKHRNKNPDFARRMDVARQFPKLIARAAVQRRIRQWDAKTALRFLELRDKQRYTSDIGVREDDGQAKAPVVQFISVASDEWTKNTTNPDSQTSTRPEYVWPSYSSSWEPETPWENEEQALRNIDSLTFSNE